MFKTIKILCFDEATEAIALRGVLERFNFKVELAYIGRPNDFIYELNNSKAQYIILSGHGNKDEFLMPILGEDVYEEDEPRQITSKVLEEKLTATDKIIISTACQTGTQNLAISFLNKDNIYIAPTDYVEGSSSLFFVIRLLYEKLVLNKTLDIAFNLAKENDHETRVFKLFK